MRRGIAPIVGSRILDVERPRCAKRPIAVAPSMVTFRRRTIGRRIGAVSRIGKRVLVHLDSGDLMVFEPRMTGLVLLASPPTVEHLRFRVRLAGRRHKELLFWDRRGLGSVRLLSPAEFECCYGVSKIGPDGLALDAAVLRERLAHSSRAVKVALLDQRAIAGIGNLYAAEILHLARIHPERRCDELTPAQWRRLAAATREILESAIYYEGSTLADGTYRNALNKSGGYQNHHRVYARAGKPCPSCRQGLIERIVQAQRATFFCPRCQKLPPQ